MRLRTSVMSAALGLGVAVALGVAPTAGAATSHAPHTSHAALHYSQQGESAQANQAFLDAVMKKVAEKQAVHPSATTTITFDSGDAPSFASEISQSMSIWNSSVSNVKLQQVSSGGDFYYTEGSDPEGSYASTDGHGSGYVFIDYTQAGEYNPTRIVAHETGHVLGLADDYSGPCSELMSGGGPGTSCQNTHPDANEIAEVNSLWANGFAKAFARLS